MKIFILSFLILLSLNSFGTSKVGTTLRMVAADWCPYTCPSLKNKGIVTQFLSELASKNGVKLDVTFLPWARAVDKVSKNEFDGLLTAVPIEAPGLKFTSSPTALYRSCLFGIKKEIIDIELSKLNSKKLGIIEGYSYGRIFDNYIIQHRSNRGAVYTLSGNQALNRLKKMVDTNKIDFFVEDENVSKFHFKNTLLKGYCGERNPFYIGFNPKVVGLKRLLKMFNDEIRVNRKLYRNILTQNLP